MARTIQWKAIANKSPRTGLAKFAAKAIVRKGPRPAIYSPSKRAELETRKYQKSAELLVKKTPFMRCIKAILGYLREEEGFKTTRIQPVSIEALQWAAEAFIYDLFSDSVDEMVHAKRKTLNIEDRHITIKMKTTRMIYWRIGNLLNLRNSERGRALSQVWGDLGNRNWIRTRFYLFQIITLDVG